MEKSCDSEMHTFGNSPAAISLAHMFWGASDAVRRNISKTVHKTFRIMKQVWNSNMDIHTKRYMMKLLLKDKELLENSLPTYVQTHIVNVISTRYKQYLRGEI